MSRFPDFARWLVVILAVTVLAAGSAAAEESLLPEDALLTVHVDSLQSLYESPVVQRIWERARESRTLEEGLETVEARNVQEAIRFLEERLGRSWREFYADLTAGGVDAAICMEGEPQLLVIARTASEELPTEITQVAQELARRGGVPEERIKSGEHRGYTGYRIGNVALAAAGERLLIGTHPDLLKRAIDRMLDDGPPPERTASDSFGISARLDLNQFRLLPNVSEGLQVPADDGGLMTFFGGWLDLLGRHEHVTFNLTAEDDQIDAVVRFDGAEEPSPQEFAGYWADAPNERPAPLLKLPGTIYSTSWYRNYGALWDAREQLVTAKVVQQMEEADREAAAQFEALGSAVPLSEVVKSFGPRFRVVVAEQPIPPYDVDLRNELPAAALVIELKDEVAFRETADPLARVLHLIFSFEQKITSGQLEHAGATLHQLTIPHTDRDVARRDRVQYNFRPAHTITRGHFILGSTPEIVRQTIDAIDAERNGDRQSMDPGLTSEQFVDIQRLADALDRLRDAIVRQSVLGGGVDIETAEHELDVFLSILRLFETKAVIGVFTDGGFEHRATSTTHGL